MEPKLIIVEGMDSTGKTSLAKELARVLHGVYFHAGGHAKCNGDMLRYHSGIVDDAAFNLSLGNDVILDRLWPSEWCYGNVLRPGLTSKYDFKLIQEKLEPLQPQYIYCHNINGYEMHVKNHEDQDHRYGILQYEAISQEYQKLFSHNGIKSVLYELSIHGANSRSFCEQFV